jgi:hypothetical protein
MAHAQMLPTPVELMNSSCIDRLNVRGVVPAINMSGLNARLSPAALPLPNPLQRVSASMRTKALQGTSPLAGEALVATRPVASVLEKKCS